MGHFSFKMGTWMGGISKIPAAHPYPDQSWVPPPGFSVQSPALVCTNLVPDIHDEIGEIIILASVTFINSEITNSIHVQWITGWSALWFLGFGNTNTSSGDEKDDYEWKY